MSGAGGWKRELVERLAALAEPTREDLFVLLVTWLRRHRTAVNTALRAEGCQMALVEPLVRRDPGSIVRRLRAATGDEAVVVAVAATRALDQELADINVALLTGEHEGIGGERFRVRPRVVPGGIDELYGAAKDDPTFGVARRMACVPMAPVGGVRVVDAARPSPATLTRLARRREAGSLRVLVDGVVPDRAQWVSDGPWVRVERAHDDVMATLISEVLDHASSVEADVVILPELAVGPASLDHLRDRLGAHPGRHPHLVVVGLTHQASPQGPLVVNEAVILDGSGCELLRHRKLAPFSTGDGPGGLTEERLDPGDTLAVLATPVGNLSVLICKDLFDGRAEPALQLGYVTWLLVPSLSRSTGPHRDRASQLRPRRITTVVCNAWEPELERLEAGQHVVAGPTTKLRRLRSRRSVIAIDV